MSSFKPPRLLRNRHLQSIFASTGPRKLLVKRKARQLISHSQTQLLHCSDGVRMQGEYTAHQPPSKALVVMIHGWEGSSNSLYLQSAGATLLEAGFDIFRLNLRDHGPTHHLNKALFNSARLQEVYDAIALVQQKFSHPTNYLLGFSLGGNFALRACADAQGQSFELDKTIAICPVINPVNTMQNLSDGLALYHDYFRFKWAASLKKKIKHYPELDYLDDLRGLTTLQQMNEYFVPRHTHYPDSQQYLMDYAVTGDRLAGINSPCHIISSADDPVISAADLEEVCHNDHLTIELTQYGGHCGYIKNYRLESWVDERLVTLLTT